MIRKFFKRFKPCNLDQLAEDCKELNFRISEFYTTIYDASTTIEERSRKASICSEQFELIAKRYSLEVYEAVYYSHYEELNQIRKALVDYYTSVL